MSTIQSVGYFSKQECECGCKNLLPQRLVDRGWKYLRGHKPVIKQHESRATVRKDKLNTGRAPITKPGTVINHSIAVAYYHAQVKLLDAQLDVAMLERKDLADQLTLSVTKIHRLQNALAKMSDVLRALEAVAKLGDDSTKSNLSFENAPR